jgi:hypothetical protein
VHALFSTSVEAIDMLRSPRPKNQKKVIKPLRMRLNFGARYVKLYRIIVTVKLAIVAIDIQSNCIATNN